MYESAFLEHRLDKASYKAEEPKLRAELLEAQLDLVEGRKFSVLILVTGMDGAGKGELIQRLYEWLDPRHVRTNGYEEPDEGERQRPWMWRYWRDLPPRGEVGVVFGSWYNDLIHAHGAGDIDEAAFARGLEAIARFEQMIAEEGTLILKFMLVVSEKEQRKRLRAIEEELGRQPARARGVDRASRRERQEGPRAEPRGRGDGDPRHEPAARALDRAAERRFRLPRPELRPRRS